MKSPDMTKQGESHDVSMTKRKRVESEDSSDPIAGYPLSPRTRTLSSPDRFLPAISPTHFLPSPPEFPTIFTRSVAKACGISVTSPILAYGTPLRPNLAPQPSTPRHNRSVDLNNLDHFLNEIMTTPVKSRKRRIQRAPVKVLDAPGIEDDFYIDILDWSRCGVIAIALYDKIYLWNEKHDSVHELFALEPSNDNLFTSVAFSRNGDFLAVGDKRGFCYLFDLSLPLDQVVQRTIMPDYTATRISRVSWSCENRLAVAYYNGQIKLFRIETLQSRRYTPYATLRGHEGVVMSLDWNCLDGSHHILASGGEDGSVVIWDTRLKIQKKVLRDHCSSVRALAFCPWQRNTLATGGGNLDQHIRLYNIESGNCISNINTESQVCKIVWSRHYKELISSHSVVDKNQLIIRKFPGLEEIASLPGHTARPLYLALSPDGQTVVSASGDDQNMKFWRCFEVKSGQKRLDPGDLSDVSPIMFR